MTTRKYGRNTGGKFASGNPGKPTGARHKATLAVEAILEGEAKKLGQKAVEMALAGDTVALRLCLDRLAPTRKARTVTFYLPPTDDAVGLMNGLNSVVHAVSAGILTTEEGTAIASLLDMKRKAVELIEIETRIAALEEKSL